MKIIHIMYYRNVKSNGVVNIVPQYVLSQSKNENVMLFNANKESEYLNENIIVKNRNDGDFDKVLCEFIPDIVIFHEIYLIEYIKYANMCYKKNIPYVIVPHGSLTNMAQKIKPLKKIVANLILFNKFVNRASSVHFLSENEKKDSKCYKNSFIIANGCENKEINFYKKNFYKKNITFIGRISIYHKGLDILVNAVEPIKNELIKQEIIIQLYGPDDKQDFEKLKKIIEDRNLQTVIKLNQEVYDQEKISVLSNTKYFIQSSRFEGMPLSLLEALSYGIPIIVTSGCNMDNVLSNYNCGIRCKNDSEALSKIILEAISESKKSYEEKQLKGIECINDCFSWDNVSYKCIKKYKDIINKGSNI